MCTACWLTHCSLETGDQNTLEDSGAFLESLCLQKNHFHPLSFFKVAVSKKELTLHPTGHKESPTPCKVGREYIIRRPIWSFCQVRMLASNCPLGLQAAPQSCRRRLDHPFLHDLLTWRIFAFCFGGHSFCHTSGKILWQAALPSPLCAPQILRMIFKSLMLDI